MNLNLVNIFIIVLNIIILVLLAYYFYHLKRIKSNYNSLVKNVSKGNLEEILKVYINQVDKYSRDLRKFQKDLKSYHDKLTFCIQKVGFKRFNPFHETGGDQSFILILLDNNNNGIILSSLHQRDGTRVYAKEIINGKTNYKLISEEESLLAQTISK